MNQSSSTKIRVIVTGATGMVGEGVLHECLNHPQVEAVLIVNRKPSGFSHAKLTEVIHNDFFDLTAIEQQLVGYNACYFCLGVSSVGMKEPEYTTVTYDLTLNFAKTLSRLNSDMTFTYVSGAHTDSTEKGSSMWARVKGKTENHLARLPFKQEFNFRPGLMKAAPDAQKTPKLYKYLEWLYPFLHLLFPNSSCLLSEVGQAMINVTLHGFDKNILEVSDIVAVAHN
ncbi:NAD-dependent epimerase/dehydratase family protein [Mucilaginibacter gracilis]|uniref:NAD-dependent epimerase/dehydratase family protein n=1 Tax=Mucilaginibacter gracilis TaxID=423350 RepID=A0A495IYH1_9SPHI|nr:NAD-dependent epimerase/dehydratase family protein [Mucilaginibacter gracilis]RKR81104.1 NAD-dependent epimerase/dehydratase family protein [Mucilaginibacter gracilis]